MASLDRECCHGCFVYVPSLSKCSSRAPTPCSRETNKVSRDSDLEDALNRVASSSKYIKAKGVFQTVYTTRPSKRPVHGLIVSALDSAKAEAGMIAKLEGSLRFRIHERIASHMSLTKDLTEISKMARTHDKTGRRPGPRYRLWDFARTDGQVRHPEGRLAKIRTPHALLWTEAPVRCVEAREGKRLSDATLVTLKEQYIFANTSSQTTTLAQHKDHNTLSLDELLEEIAEKKAESPPVGEVRTDVIQPTIVRGDENQKAIDAPLEKEYVER
ncbi:hypothetical protein FRB90_006526, partial [Tulasnella sp. 427]